MQLREDNNFKIILPYQKVISISATIILGFLGLIGYGFYYLKKTCDSLELSVQKNSESFNRAILDLRQENVLLKQQLVQAKQEVLIVPPGNSIYNIDVANVIGLILICLSIVAILIGAYYLGIYFFKETFIGQILYKTNYYACYGLNWLSGGSEPTRTFVVPIADDFQLKVILTGDSKCAVLFRECSESNYLPFERFLEHYKSLVSPKINVDSIQQALSDGNSSNLLETISSTVPLTSESTLKGVEALSAFF